MKTKYIKRSLEDTIQSHFFKGKAIIIYGPRQCGKTTMLRHLIDTLDQQAIWLDGDFSQTQELLTDMSIAKWKLIASGAQIIVIDEAQRIKGIGLAIKIAVDNLPDLQIIATGSSSFELAGFMQEPLTGRTDSYYLYPLTFGELYEAKGFSSEYMNIEERLTFGSYPAIVQEIPYEDTLKSITELANNYLFKDLFLLNDIRRPNIFIDLVKALALQIGNTVSISELVDTIHSDRQTVEKYLSYLQQAYIIFALSPYSTNERNEIKKNRKYYFWDVGIRNAILQRFSLQSINDDIGHLWENYLIAERQKLLLNSYPKPTIGFWRDKQQHEVDYIEQGDNSLIAWEIKWNRKPKDKIPSTFHTRYPQAITTILSKDNYPDFLLARQTT